ncbi:UPF0182 family protein [Nocardioides coralli]|uniref:UPF0182 family membrane protein n=1 Tax=Nocardioides coralli TaxID=2872154 RepID=UPI001CA3F714|nr:UPF0182 family protein [Nocardioides coralli]QZY30110.1 UPF0182 family protein [Nocardioides coralli]
MSDLFDEGSPQRPTRPPTQEPPRRSRALVITAVVLVLGFFALTTFATFWTDRSWFASIGFSSVFSTLLWTRIGLFLVFGAVMAAFVGANMYLAYRFRPMFRMPSPEQTGLDRYREVVTPIRTWLVVGVSLLMGLFAGTSASGQWREYMLWRNSVDVGDVDPYFERDKGFYLFDLPWLHYLTDSVMAFAIVALLVAGLVHYLYGGIQLQTKTDRLSGAAQVQLSALLGVFVLAKGADYWLDRFDLVTNQGSLITGMTYTGENAVLPAKSILMGIAVICAVLFFLNTWRRTWLLPSVGLALLALSAVLIGMIWPAVVQQFRVKPTEADREAPYLEVNIDATREAYALEGIEVAPYTGQTAERRLAMLAGETASVPLVDPQVVNRTFEQVQQVRAYYSVADVLDVDHYEIDGTDRALVLGVRELDQTGISEADQNWNNLHTVYTHGNGVIAAFANQRGEDDASDSAEIPWAEGQQPGQDALTNLFPDGYEDRVYFGELSPTYSVVGKPSDDAPSVELDLGKSASDDESRTTTYDGAGGVPVGNLFAKLMYAVRFGEPNFLLSGRVHENSKVLYNRTPRERVERVAPWLTVDADPYPAVVEGRIVWILDGYTTTDRYPNAERESFDTMIDDSLTQDATFGTLPTDEVNYIRNAVKATVDAYDGTVNLYAWDEDDPILQAWRGAFPDVVQDRSEIPEAIVPHLRYPEDMFKAQRYQFARYHVTEAGDFYQGNDRWEVPEDPYASGSYQPPYRLFIDDPTSEEEEVWSLTSVFVPRNKNNLASFVSVNSDATSPDYGRISVLQLPNEQTPGPGLIANEMANSDDVRRELQAFNLGEIDPTFGNLLTLPVGDGLMYVQPVYAVRELSEASYPILQFVIVSYGNRVGIGTSLVQALADALGVDPDQVDEPAPPDPEEPAGEEPTEPPTQGSVEEQIASLLRQAQAAFDAADEAYGEGDLVRAAEQTERAQNLIERAVRLADGQQSGDQG